MIRASDIDLLTSNEVARRLRVDAATVARWAWRGRVPCRPNGEPGVIRIPSGHYRFHADAIERIETGELLID